MLNEFRAFIRRGNVLDLAVGVIIGSAFTAIVNSVVNDLINPLIGAIVGGRADFSSYFIPLAGQTATTLIEARAAGPVLGYGAFLTAVVNFLLVAFVVFLLVRTTNRLVAVALRQTAAKAEQPTAAADPAAAVDPLDELQRSRKVLEEIRDALAAQRRDDAPR